MIIHTALCCFLCIYLNRHDAGFTWFLLFQNVQIFHKVSFNCCIHNRSQLTASNTIIQPEVAFCCIALIEEEKWYSFSWSAPNQLLSLIALLWLGFHQILFSEHYGNRQDRKKNGDRKTLHSAVLLDKQIASGVRVIHSFSKIFCLKKNQVLKHNAPASFFGNVSCFPIEMHRLRFVLRLILLMARITEIGFLLSHMETFGHFLCRNQCQIHIPLFWCTACSFCSKLSVPRVSQKAVVSC